MQRLAAAVPAIEARAAERDETGSFPTEELALLAQAGVLAAPLPAEGTGTADALATLLATVGRASLPLGRILEAHVNARHLIACYGTPAQRAAAAADVAAGHLFALWVTDPPQDGLALRRAGDTLHVTGGKQFCSAAGHATRALVTARTESGAAQMLVLRLGQGERVAPLPAPLSGMRAAVTGAADFSGCRAPVEAMLGEPGDYLREPAFSTGAWRGSAVALGGLIAVVAELQDQLRAAGRLDDPHQAARLGHAMIARETARAWVARAARIAEDPAAHPSEAVATVGLARLAVEFACLDAMRRGHRALGLAAFRRGNPMERLCRDLATYLRQPAPDAVLTESAAWFAAQPASPLATVANAS
jgi:alkylation response protein AidB-like acyl-CoA dehydrogenase